MARASGSQSSRRASSPWPHRREVLREREAVGTPAEADGEAEARGLQLHRERDAQAEEAGEEVQGRGQRRAVERAAAPVVDPLDPEVLLLEQQVGGPGAPRQRQGAAVRADHQVRAVVDVVAGHGVARRGGPAAENAAPLEEHDLVAALLERDRRGKAGEAAAHDEDLHQTFQ